MSSASLIKTPAERVRVNSVVFFTSTLLILLLTALLIAVPETAGQVLGQAQAWLSRSFGWYYMLVIGGYLLFVIAIAFSRYGNLKLGGKDDKPDFSYGAWAGMLFPRASVSRCCTSARPSRWTTTSTRLKAPRPAWNRRVTACS